MTNNAYRKPLAVLAAVLLAAVLLAQIIMPRMDMSLELSYHSTCWTGGVELYTLGSTCSTVSATPVGFPFVINNDGNNPFQNSLTALVDFFPAILLATFLMSTYRKRS